MTLKESANTIFEAVQMREEDQAAKMEVLQEALMDQNVYQWGASIFEELYSVSIKDKTDLP